jgi:cell division protein FtsL
MATRTSNTRYASRSAVHGSNAYDLNKLGELARKSSALPAAVPAPKAVPQNVPKTTPRTAPRTTKKTQRSYSVSLTAAAGFAVAAVLVVFVLLSHVRFAEVTNQSVELQKTLNQLNEQGRKLQIAYEDAFDVNQIERYATSQLGMSKPSENQLGTISATAQDKAVVADSQDKAPRRGENMATFLASLLAYFK